jgi:hypothetical protein
VGSIGHSRGTPSTRDDRTVRHTLQAPPPLRLREEIPDRLVTAAQNPSTHIPSGCQKAPAPRPRMPAVRLEGRQSPQEPGPWRGRFFVLRRAKESLPDSESTDPKKDMGSANQLSAGTGSNTWGAHGACHGRFRTFFGAMASFQQVLTASAVSASEGAWTQANPLEPGTRHGRRGSRRGNICRFISDDSRLPGSEGTWEVGGAWERGAKATVATNARFVGSSRRIAIKLCPHTQRFSTLSFVSFRSLSSYF